MQKKIFAIGDQVAILNDNIRGVIISIKNSIVLVKCEDGFEIECSENELVKSGDFYSYLNDSNHDEFLKENDFNIKKKSTGKKGFPKSKTPPMEVDLHINKLIRNTKGMSNFEILNFQLDTAKKQLEFAIRKKIQRVVFIHGIGDGILKNELQYLFAKYPVNIQEASYQKYGIGATEVYIFQQN